MNYLILFFTILFFILARRRLDLAVMFLIAALPAYLIRFNILGLPSTLLEVMIWVVFLAWLLKSYKYIFENLKLKIKNWKNTIPLSPPLSRGKNRYPFDWEIVLLLLVALIAAGVAGFGASSFGIWKAYFFEPVLLFIVVVNVMIKSPQPPLLKGVNTARFTFLFRGVELILWPLAISALAVSVLAVYQKITGQLIDNPAWAAAGARRVVSFFGYPNAVGLYLGPLVLVFIGWLFNVICPPSKGPSRSRRAEAEELRGLKNSVNLTSLTLLYKEGNNQNDKLKTIFISLTIIFSLLSIYFAHSKGALLGVAAGLIMFGLLANKKIRWATVAVAIIAAIGLAAYQPARKVALNTATFKTLSGQIRLAGWRDSWNMLKDGRLLTGIGLANYQKSVAPFHTQGVFIKDPNDPEAQKKLVFNPVYRTAHWQPLEIYLYPHNIILNFWSELGLAGLLLFVWVVIKYFWLGISNFQFPISKKIPNYKSQKYLIIGLIGAMVVIIVHGIVDVPYFKNDLAVMFWLLVAMMSIINLEFKYFNEKLN